MPLRDDPEMLEALRLAAPGQPLREGLDRILHSNMGALVVVGDGPEVLAICSGGFLLDAEYSPQRLSELAKMDGAIILAPDASRIARANVHLLPDPGVPTTETGTRHRTAERVARSVDVPVISVSEEMSVIAVYRGDRKHRVESIGHLLDRSAQAISTLERYRHRLDSVLAELSMHEVTDQVTVRDVVTALQRVEMMRRLRDEAAGFVVELGREGRLVQLQLDELCGSAEKERALLVRDYVTKPDAVDARVRALERLGDDDLLEHASVARAFGLVDPQTHGPVSLQTHLRARGYRMLSKLPRLSDSVITRVVDDFDGLPSLLDASVQRLTRVDGVGEVRARAIRDGLTRVAEQVSADWRR